MLVNALQLVNEFGKALLEFFERFLLVHRRDRFYYKLIALGSCLQVFIDSRLGRDNP